MRLVALSLLLVIGMPGCTEPSPGAPSYEVAGSFTEAATQADVDDLERRLAHWEAGLAVLETYPMQYRITIADGPACDEVREMLAARPYVADVGRCRAVA